MAPLESLLADKKPSLTKIQERAMAYIMDNQNEAVFLTASRLARKAGVSEATVVRLAQTLGFNGYPEMQRMLRKEFQDRLGSVERLDDTVKQVRDERDLLVKVFQKDIQNLSQTLSEISTETFSQAVKKTAGARKVYIVGLHQSYAPALVLADTLSLIRDGIHLLEPGHGDIRDDLDGLTPEDLVVGISISRYSRSTFDALAYAREQHADVGIITDSPLSPLVRHANWVLSVKCQLDSFAASFTAAICLVNALLTAIGMKDTKKTLERLARREAIWKKKRVFVPPLSGKNQR